MTYQDSPYRSRPRYPALAEYEDPPYQDPAPYQDGGGYWDDSAHQASPAYRGAHSRQQGQASYQDAFDAPSGYQGGQDYLDAFDGSSTGYQNGRGYENSPAYQGYRDPHPSAPEGWVGYQDPGGYQDAGYRDTGYRDPGYQNASYQDTGHRDTGYQDTGYQDTMVAPRTEAVTPNARTGGGYLDDWQQGRAGRPAGLGLMTGAVAGFLAAAVVLGIATLTSALVGRQASPVTALDGIFTERLPSALRSSAVHHFGAHNRVVLLLGMYVVIAIIAMVIGNIARRKTAIGVMGIAAFGLLVAYIVITRPGSEAADAIPSVIGGLAGVGALLYLVRASLPYFGEAA